MITKNYSRQLISFYLESKDLQGDGENEGNPPPPKKIKNWQSEPGGLGGNGTARGSEAKIRRIGCPGLGQWSSYRPGVWKNVQTEWNFRFLNEF